jgi:hypothetical protein
MGCGSLEARVWSPIFKAKKCAYIYKTYIRINHSTNSELSLERTILNVVILSWAYIMTLMDYNISNNKRTSYFFRLLYDIAGC